MYDKRYTPEQIKRERWWAGFNMFVIMALLCWGVGKVAYISGYDQGYHEGRFLVPATEKTSYQVQKASLEIEIISEPDDLPEWKQMLNFILSYWIFGWIAIAFLAIYKAATYPRRNVAKVKGERNVIIQSHSGLYPPDTPI